MTSFRPVGAGANSIFNLDRRPGFGALYGGSPFHFVRDRNEWRAHVRQCYRLAGISANAHRRIEREFSQEMDVHRLSGFSTAAITEYIDALAAMRALQIAHVFDQAEDRHAHLLE